MLMQIKDKASGWIAYLIVGLISVPFALWGINQYFYLGTDPVVLEVGGEDIPYSVFQSAYRERKQYLESVMGAQNVSEQLVQRETVNSLIRERIWSIEAEKNGYFVTDLELADYIRNLPEFTRDGEFDKEKYRRIIDLRGESEATFEESLRLTLLSNRVPRFIVETAFSLKNEKERYEKLLFQERGLRYVTLVAGQFIVPGGVSTTEVETYYEENPEKFTQPEAAQLQYIELDEKELLNPDSVSTEQVTRYYTDNPNEFFAPEQLQIAHILFDVEAHGEAGAWERIETVYGELEKGVDFEKLSAEYSDDSLTAERGGELPLVTYEDLGEEYIAETLASLSPGEFSTAIQTTYGLQIFKLLDRVSSRIISIDDASYDIRSELAEQLAQEEFNDMLDQLSSLVYENVDSLKYPAETLGLEVKKTSWVSRSSNTGIMQYPKIKEAAFAEDVTLRGYNSEVIEVEAGHAVVVRAEGYRTARQKEFSEVRASITTELLLSKAFLLAEAKASSMTRALRTGSNLDSEARKAGLKVHDMGFVRRDAEGTDVERLIGEAAFRMRKPGDNRPSYRKLEHPENASYYIIELRKVRVGRAIDEAVAASEAFSYNERELEAALLTLLGGADLDISLNDLPQP